MLENLARHIFHVTIKSVLPHNLLSKTISRKGDVLIINGKQYAMKKNVYVVGFGKAVLGMAAYLYPLIEDHLVDGVLSVPYGIKESLMTSNLYRDIPLSEYLSLPSLKVYEGAQNNLPDAQALQAAKEIASLVSSVSCEDILLVLISGGGSALLPLPVKGISLAEKLESIKQIAAAGATIQELNTVRKKLSALKGGKLAQLSSTSNIVSIVISDIVNNPLDLIASGPTMPDQSTCKECLDIFRKYNLIDSLPKSVIKHITDNSHLDESKVGLENRAKSNIIGDHYLVGSNQIACENAVKIAGDAGYPSVILTEELVGEARDIGQNFANLLLGVADKTDQKVLGRLLQNIHLTCDDRAFDIITTMGKVCILSSGESTVTVTGQGLGGRNQEMVLSFTETLRKACQVNNEFLKKVSFCFLSGGTDGQDGPTDAAGAMCSNALISELLNNTTDLLTYLNNNDSYHFSSDFGAGSYLIKTGLSGTNVMDIQLLLIDLI